MHDDRHVSRRALTIEQTEIGSPLASQAARRMRRGGDPPVHDLGGIALHRNRRRILSGIVDHRGIGQDAGPGSHRHDGRGPGEIGPTGKVPERLVLLPKNAGRQRSGEGMKRGPRSVEQFHPDDGIGIGSIEQPDVGPESRVLTKLRQGRRLSRSQAERGIDPAEVLAEGPG